MKCEASTRYYMGDIDVAEGPLGSPVGAYKAWGLRQVMKGMSVLGSCIALAREPTPPNVREEAGFTLELRVISHWRCGGHGRVYVGGVYDTGRRYS